MFHALSWFFVAVLIALWSLTAWALHAGAVWAVLNAGALTGTASGASAITLPDWLTSWVPQYSAQWVSQLLAGLGPVVDNLLQAALALAGALTVATWVIWGIGSMLLAMLGAGLHLLIALWRRRNGARSVPRLGNSLAAG